MKAFLVEAAILLIALLAVMALVFRAQWARDTLRFARNMLWVYVALIVLLSAIEAYRIWG